MARSFTAADGLQANLSSITAFPLTLFCWAEHDDTTSGVPILSFGKGGSGTEYNLSTYFRGDLTGDPIAGRRVYNGSGSNTPQSPAYSANVMYAIGCVFVSATDSRLFVDGTKYTDATSVDFPDTPGYFGISLRITNSVNNMGRVGRIQQAAIWHEELNDDEMIALARGFSPRRVRPQHLARYWPSLRNNMDLRSGETYTVIGTTPSVVDHLRTYGM